MNVNLLLRQVHGYVGFLTAPTLLFFAATGMIQVLNLHQAHDAYTPPAAVVALASLHKDQVLARPHRHRAITQRPAAGKHEPPPQEAPPKLATNLLKAFVLLAAGSLIVSVVLGLWIGLKDRRRRTVHLVLLAAGVVVPATLILALG